MSVISISTQYGNVCIHEDTVSITASETQLYQWASRSPRWFCSDLEHLESVFAAFDPSGLIDLDHQPALEGYGSIAGDEFNAWSSDVLREVLPKSHPCYLVTVGQFDDQL